MCALDLKSEIGTERLILRPPDAADVLPICELADDLCVAGNTRTLPHPFRMEDAEACVARLSSADPRVRAGFVIEHRQLGVVGMLSLSEGEAKRPHLGLFVGRPFWGRGYATEAVSGALRWIRGGGWGRRAVWAGHFADNRAAGQVLVKAGFLYTGDVVMKMSAARAEPVLTRMMVWLA